MFPEYTQLSYAVLSDGDDLSAHKAVELRTMDIRLHQLEERYLQMGPMGLQADGAPCGGTERVGGSVPHQT